MELIHSNAQLANYGFSSKLLNLQFTSLSSAEKWDDAKSTVLVTVLRSMNGIMTLHPQDASAAKDSAVRNTVTLALIQPMSDYSVKH